METLDAELETDDTLVDEEEVGCAELEDEMDEVA